MNLKDVPSQLRWLLANKHPCLKVSISRFAYTHPPINKSTLPPLLATDPGLSNEGAQGRRRIGGLSAQKRDEESDEAKEPGSEDEDTGGERELMSGRRNSSRLISKSSASASAQTRARTQSSGALKDGVKRERKRSARAADIAVAKEATKRARGANKPIRPRNKESKRLVDKEVDSDDLTATERTETFEGVVLKTFFNKPSSEAEATRDMSPGKDTLVDLCNSMHELNKPQLTIRLPLKRRSVKMTEMRTSECDRVAQTTSTES